VKVVSLDIIAKLDDGFIDLVSLNEFPVEKISQVVQELMESEVRGEYVKRYRVPWVEWESEVEMPINLDGEPISTKKISF
jgi:diacylglycerol kinase family enzyme